MGAILAEVGADARRTGAAVAVDADPGLVAALRPKAFNSQQLAGSQLRTVQRETQGPQRAQVDLIIATVVLIWAVASFCVGVKRYSDGGKRMVCSDAVEQLDNPFDIAADGGGVSHVARIWNLDADEELLRSMDFGVMAEDMSSRDGERGLRLESRREIGHRCSLGSELRYQTNLLL